MEKLKNGFRFITYLLQLSRMVIIIELIALIIFLLLSRKDLKKIFFLSKETITKGILLGLVYSLLIFVSKQTALGSDVINQFIRGIQVPFFVLYIIYPLVIAVSEEFIFRYYIANRFGVYLAALLFMLLHWRPNFPTLLFLPVFIFSLSQSWLFNKTKTLFPTIIIHLFVTYSLLLL